MKTRIYAAPAVKVLTATFTFYWSGGITASMAVVEKAHTTDVVGCHGG